MRKGSFAAALSLHLGGTTSPKTFVASLGSGQAMKYLEPGTTNE